MSISKFRFPAVPDREITRADIVTAARRWDGTPFLWQGCVRGKGVDCKNLLVGIARDLKLPEAETLAARRHDYRRGFDPAEMLAGLEESLIRAKSAKPGDVIAFEIGTVKGPRHLALLTEPGRIIHCYGAGPSRVIEVPLGNHRRVHSYWTWPSLGGK